MFKAKNLLWASLLLVSSAYLLPSELGFIYEDEVNYEDPLAEEKDLSPLAHKYIESIHGAIKGATEGSIQEAIIIETAARKFLQEHFGGDGNVQRAIALGQEMVNYANGKYAEHIAHYIGERGEVADKEAANDLLDAIDRAHSFEDESEPEFEEESSRKSYFAIKPILTPRSID